MTTDSAGPDGPSSAGRPAVTRGCVKRRALGSARPRLHLRVRHLQHGLVAVRRLAAGGRAEDPSPLGGFRSVQASRGRPTTVLV